MTLARASQPRPRFTDLTTLHAAIVGGSASSHRSWPLYCPGVAGGDDVEVGRWERRGASAVLVGPMRLEHLQFRSTILAGVVDPTHATATAGHGFVTGDTLRFWDVSAGAELGDRVVTVSGDGLAWSGAVAGLVAGQDTAFAVLDSPLTIGDATRQVCPSARSWLSSAGAGFVLRPDALNQRGVVCIHTQSSGMAYTYLGLEMGWTVAMAAVGPGASAGLFSSTGMCLRAGTANNGAQRSVIVTGAIAAPSYNYGTTAITPANIVGSHVAHVPIAAAPNPRCWWLGSAHSANPAEDQGTVFGLRSAVLDDIKGFCMSAAASAAQIPTMTMTRCEAIWQ